MKLPFSKKNAHWLKETICNVIDFTHFIIRLQSNETRLQSNGKRLQKNVINISWNVHVLLYYFPIVGHGTDLGMVYVSKSRKVLGLARFD